MANKIGLLAAFTVLIITGIVFAEEFSADVKSSSSAGGFDGKIYISGDKIRMEVPGGVTITRMDRMTAYILVPAQNTYMEQKLDPSIIASSSSRIQGETERAFIGDEVLNGKNTKKYRVSYQSGAGSATVYQWIDPSIEIPVRTEDINGKWSMEFRNIKKEDQDSTLFEIPASYAKFELPDMSEIMNKAQKEILQDVGQENDGTDSY